MEQNERMKANIMLKFTSKIHAADTKVMNVIAVTHWANLTGRPTLMKYNGPKFVIHNLTTNCIKGIEKPERLEI